MKDTLITVAVCPPAHRMYAVFRAYDMQSPILDIMEPRICPVLALRTQVSAGGTCEEKVLIYDEDYQVCDTELATCGNDALQLVVCPWPWDEERDKQACQEAAENLREQLKFKFKLNQEREARKARERAGAN